MSIFRLKVGDQVFYVPNDFRFGRRVANRTVTKVGRKFVYLDGPDGLRIEPWSHDGYAFAHVVGYPGGVIYPSEQDYLEMMAWNRFVNFQIGQVKNRDQRKAIINFVEGFPSE